MRSWPILVSAALIALAIYAASFTGRYEIAGTSNVVSMWRVDRLTGKVEVCFFAESDNPFDKIAGVPREIKCADHNQTNELAHKE